MAVATIDVPLGALVLKVLVELGAQNALRKRLLQVVKQTLLGENLVRITTGKQLVQKFFLDSHVMILSFPSSWPRAQNS
jgi:16S rRNA G527 N7-methylase RsmG